MSFKISFSPSLLIGLSFGPKFLGFLSFFSLLLSHFPSLLSMFECPNLDTFGYVNFIDSLNFKICVDYLEEVKFMLCD